MRDVSWQFQGFIIKHGHLIFAVLYLFPKIVGFWLDLDWIVNPFWKLDLDLDCQSHICVGFGLDLDWIGLSISLTTNKVFKRHLVERKNTNLCRFDNFQILDVLWRHQSNFRVRWDRRKPQFECSNLTRRVR